jgi:hypothetical protein
VKQLEIIGSMQNDSAEEAIIMKRLTSVCSNDPPAALSALLSLALRILDWNPAKVSYKVLYSTMRRSLSALVVGAAEWVEGAGLGGGIRSSSSESFLTERFGCFLGAMMKVKTKKRWDVNLEGTCLLNEPE